jgi:hypothetical protein
LLEAKRIEEDNERKRFGSPSCHPSYVLIWIHPATTQFCFLLQVVSFEKSRERGREKG